MRLRLDTFTDFAELPRGCRPLAPSVGPNAVTAVRNHLDALPMLDAERLLQFERVAADTNPNVNAASDRELVLEDLLRMRADATVTLHPHVLQVIPVGVADALLQAVGLLLGLDTDTLRYLHPRFILEYHDITADRETFFPPEYSIETLDVLYDLRANDILTSIRRPDDAFTPADAACEQSKPHRPTALWCMRR